MLSFTGYTQGFGDFSTTDLILKLDEKEDTSHISINVEIASQLQRIYEDDSSRSFIKNGIQLCDKFKYYKHLPALHRQMAVYYEYAKTDHDSALYFF